MRIKLCSIDKTNHVKTFSGGTFTAVATPFFTYKLLYTTGLVTSIQLLIQHFHRIIFQNFMQIYLFIYRPFDFG